MEYYNMQVFFIVGNVKMRHHSLEIGFKLGSTGLVIG